MIPGGPSDSDVTIVNVYEPGYSPLVTTLLEILVHAKVIDTPTANSFLVTFGKLLVKKFDPIRRILENVVIRFRRQTAQR